MLKYIKPENNYKKKNHNITTFYCIFDQINAAMLSMRDVFQKF